jgi:hypothetical protein
MLIRFRLEAKATQCNLKNAQRKRGHYIFGVFCGLKVSSVLFKTFAHEITHRLVDTTILSPDDFETKNFEHHCMIEHL